MLSWWTQRRVSLQLQCRIGRKKIQCIGNWSAWRASLGRASQCISRWRAGSNLSVQWHSEIAVPSPVSVDGCDQGLDGAPQQEQGSGVLGAVLQHVGDWVLRRMCALSPTLLKHISVKHWSVTAFPVYLGVFFSSSVMLSCPAQLCTHQHNGQVELLKVSVNFCYCLRWGPVAQLMAAVMCWSGTKG